jgi:phi13 family phage major tail protein
VIKTRADGMDYYVVNDNLGYSGDLNIAMVPDWFRQDYLNETLDDTAKVLVENSNNNPKPFAMTFEFAGDASRRRHVLYNVATSRPNIHGENKDNQKEPDTDTLSLTASPLPDGRVKASTTKDTPDDIYKGWNANIWEAAKTAE